MKPEAVGFLLVTTVVIGGITYYIMTREPKEAKAGTTKGSCPTPQPGQPSIPNQPDGWGCRFDGGQPEGTFYARAKKSVRVFEAMNRYDIVNADRSSYGAYQFLGRKVSGGYVPLQQVIGYYYNRSDDNSALQWKDASPQQFASNDFYNWWQNVFQSSNRQAMVDAQEDAAEVFYFKPAREYLAQKGWYDIGRIVAVYNAVIFAGFEDMKKHIEEKGLYYALQYWRDRPSNGTSENGAFRWEYCIMTMALTCPWPQAARVKRQSWREWFVI